MDRVEERVVAMAPEIFEALKEAAESLDNAHVCILHGADDAALMHAYAGKAKAQALIERIVRGDSDGG